MSTLSRSVAALDAPSVAGDPFPWRDRAACRYADTDLFFPVGRGAAAARQAAFAKMVCQRCSVSAECLEYALTYDCLYGVFGGTTEDERRLIRRRGLTEARGA